MMENPAPASAEATATVTFPGAERRLGVYPQRQPGRFLQRIRLLGGRIGWPQWRQVIELGRRHCERATLHVTTRQDIELHDLAGSDVQAIQQGLAEVGLVTRGACGDSVRNITVCPGCPRDAGTDRAFAAAQLAHRHLADYSCDLPRKFKISFSGCPRACAKPWISDLGFIVRASGRWAVVGAGSLGPRPGRGLPLYEDLAPRDILPLCLATLEFFQECGERENRGRARLRHLRERLGDEPFRAQLDARFVRLRAARAWPDIPAGTRPQGELLRRLQLPNGNLGWDDALQLAAAAEPAGAELRINLEHGLELFGARLFALPEPLAALEGLPVIVACPGRSSCSKGLVDTWAVADAIRQRLAGRPQPALRIGISGCPNSCAHSAVADIGLIGLRRTQDGRTVDCFRLLTGGGDGRDDSPAADGGVFTAEEIPAAVEHLVGTAPRCSRDLASGNGPTIPKACRP